jgi:hypothetical protein
MVSADGKTNQRKRRIPHNIVDVFLSRRFFLALPSALTAARPRRGVSLNEDPNQFFSSRADRRIDRALLEAWVDQYGGTQVRELILCTNAMRTAFASRQWTAFWDGYDPAGGDDQPLFAALPGTARKMYRRWIHAAWQMHQDGLDHIAIWIARARRKGLSPWVSMRMNDLHDVDNERHPLHSEFWKAHPEFRRVPYRGEQRDKALDFARPEVRDYCFKLIEEMAGRWRFDGLELDWMRHGFHFAPGREAEGRRLLNAFMLRVRRALPGRVRLAVRVPSRPETALRLGLDAVEWARSGAVDFVTPTNYWRTVDTAMPVALWRQLLPGSCTLAAGLELGLNAHPASKAAGGRPFQTNSLETVRGAAAAYLEQGADRVYLFNYMDRDTAIEDLDNYPALLSECGELDTLRGKPRRHVVTYQDTWAPGEPRAYALPVQTQPGNWIAFRVLCGPAEPGRGACVRLGISAAPKGWQVRLNGALAEPRGTEELKPGPAVPCYRFDLREALAAGENVVEVTPASAAAIEWVELAYV